MPTILCSTQNELEERGREEKTHCSATYSHHTGTYCYTLDCSRAPRGADSSGDDDDRSIGAIDFFARSASSGKRANIAGDLGDGGDGIDTRLLLAQAQRAPGRRTRTIFCELASTSKERYRERLIALGRDQRRDHVEKAADYVRTSTVVLEAFPEELDRSFAALGLLLSPVRIITLTRAGVFASAIKLSPVMSLHLLGPF
ncbi:hypothetical protein SELMODRAFT_414572 [Selaginella moellendorffii]|uniref:Uncharacterized protein n=1 Tax=Selaginella moellendorffii TaxID=88036 RepID=D8RT76_SELML|nr:hypothetical protein SELMODRAFT_414572 [Selaginella moellendorffii]